jgi:hypothetical protein
MYCAVLCVCVVIGVIIDGEKWRRVILMMMTAFPMVARVVLNNVLCVCDYYALL